MGGAFICLGTNVQYVARVRAAGKRRMTLIGAPSRSLNAATMRLARAMAASTYYRIGDVIMTADYYEPLVILEMKRP